MSEWVDSREAAEIIGCTRANLYNIVHKFRHDHIIQRKKMKGEGSTGSYLLYNRSDCEVVKQKRSQQSKKANGVLQPRSGNHQDGFVVGHPAMLRVWSAEGMKEMAL